jgi:predicted amidophosphoribosyltransferase
MRRKKASEIFGGVDPHLKVVDGGVRRSSRRRVSTEEEWAKSGGLFCPQCGDEVVRLIDGICRQCFLKQEAEQAAHIEDRAQRRYYQRMLN